MSTRLAGRDLAALVGRVADDAGIAPPAGLAQDVEVVRRAGGPGTFLFAINHTAHDAKVPLEAPGTELLTSERAAGHLAVPAGSVRVVRLDG